MREKSQRGSITVFLSIILAITVFLTGTIVEASRIRIANSQATRALMNAKNSLLAGYDTKLKEYYGLFAIDDIKNNDIANTLEFFLRSNLRPFESANETGAITTQGEYWNLFDYTIDGIRTTPHHNLNNSIVLERQIMDFMRFRAPIRAAYRVLPSGTGNKAKILGNLFSNLEDGIEGIDPEDSFADKTKSLGDIGNAGDSINMMIEIDRQLFELHGVLERLYSRIKDINSFSKEIFQASMDQINAMSNSYSELLTWAEEEENNLNERIQQIRTEINNLGPDDQEARQALREEILALQQELAQVRETVRNARQDLIDEIGSMNSKIIRFSNYNSDAIARIGMVREKMKHIDGMIEAFGEHVNANKECIMYNQMSEAYKYYRAINVEGLDELATLLQHNITVLNECQTHINNIRDAVNALEALSPEQRSEKISVIGTVVSHAKTKSADYNNRLETIIVGDKPEDTVPPVDPRGAAVNELKTILTEAVTNIVGSTIPEEVYIELPSNIKIVADEQTLHATELNINDINFDEGLDEGEEGFMDKTVAGAGNILGKLPGAIADLGNAFFISEYIKGTFKSRITREKPENEAIHDINLRGKAKSDRDSFLNFEMEYVLFGNRYDAANLSLSVASIKAIRFMSNLAYVFTCKIYLGKAHKIALAAATISKVGAPLVYPIVKALVLGAFALKLTVRDISDLLAGKEVAIFKRNKTPTMNYEEYLYKFLLIALYNPQTELMRINDLIQINMQSEKVATNEFEMIEYYTYVDTKVDLSIRNIFLNIVDQTEEIGFVNRARHNFSVVVVDGY